MLSLQAGLAAGSLGNAICGHFCCEVLADVVNTGEKSPRGMTWPEEQIVWWPLMSTARCLPRDCASWWSKTLVLPTGLSPHFASEPCLTCSFLVTSKRQHFLFHERVWYHPESPPLAVSPEVPLSTTVTHWPPACSLRKQDSFCSPLSLQLSQSSLTIKMCNLPKHGRLALAS